MIKIIFLFIGIFTTVNSYSQDYIIDNFKDTNIIELNIVKIQNNQCRGYNYGNICSFDLSQITMFIVKINDSVFLTTLHYSLPIDKKYNRKDNIFAYTVLEINKNRLTLSNNSSIFSKDLIFKKYISLFKMDKLDLYKNDNHNDYFKNSNKYYEVFFQELLEFLEPYVFAKRTNDRLKRHIVNSYDNIKIPFKVETRFEENRDFLKLNDSIYTNNKEVSNYLYEIKKNEIENKEHLSIYNKDSMSYLRKSYEIETHFVRVNSSYKMWDMKVKKLEYIDPFSPNKSEFYIQKIMR
jgi:hypothetical protein